MIQAQPDTEMHLEGRKQLTRNPNRMDYGKTEESEDFSFTHCYHIKTMQE